MTSPLVVFSDDWGRHPSSCQHLVRHLLDEFDVTWVNTIGTRPPRLDRTTLLRGAEKLRHWGSRSARHAREADAVPAPRVLNPMMWPGFGSAWQRGLNLRLIRRNLERNVEGLASSTVLTTIPLVADLVGRVPAARWIYYCVDDFSKWPGLDGKTLEEMEALLVDKVDEVVAAGENLAERIRPRGREPVVLTHGVDVDHWAMNDAALLPERLAELEHPVALFWGLVDRRLDVQWLQCLSDSMEQGSIVLVGPEQSPHPALAATNRLHLPGPVPYSELPAMAAIADVLIMPYADLPVTRAMQPLKLKEYLATGKPVVVRNLPAAQAWDDCLDAVDDAGAFVEAVQQRFESGIPVAQQAARRRLEDETWSAKANQLKIVLEAGSTAVAGAAS